ncbi:MAG TPA: hypothetical protein VM389_11340 [Phycisphaerae bacterium]|nr:hypothetical protein [Phycisphaerae bacterium]HUU23115.1 hypothetical protein [Phycisphaerae bacterium]
MTMPSVHEAQPIEAAPPRTSTWPVVLGVLSVLAGYESMTLLGGVGSPGGAALLRGMMAGDFSSLKRMDADMPLAAAASLCAGAAGIAGGIMLLRRRPSALWLHWVYALARIAVALGCMTMYQQALAGLQDRSPEVWSRMMYRIATSQAMGLLYPIFVLVWFGQQSVIRHVAVWRTQGGRAASRPAGPVWPTVLGVMALIAGGQGLLQAELQLLGMVLFPWPEPGDLDARVQSATLLWTSPGALLSVLSLVWGTLLLRRRGSARVWCIVQAVASIAMAGALPLILTWTGWFADSPNRLDSILWTIMASALTAAWAVFLLVWFARPRIRAQVRSWGRGASPPAAEVPS